MSVMTKYIEYIFLISLFLEKAPIFRKKIIKKYTKVDACPYLRVDMPFVVDIMSYGI